MKVRIGLLGAFAFVMMVYAPAWAQQQSRPNILFIMGDDVGWFNVGAYHRGIQGYRI
jgi:arylsulfatase